jgi:hypothetical protein
MKMEQHQQELDAYTKAKQYLQTCSYREVASWLSATTKRPISAQGLRKKVLNEKQQQTTESRES